MMVKSGKTPDFEPCLRLLLDQCDGQRPCGCALAESRTLGDQDDMVKICISAELGSFYLQHVLLCASLEFYYVLFVLILLLV